MNDDQRNWLAMQYVLGELSESDRDAFEERMADDLRTCEAVAEASRLRLMLRAASEESTAIPNFAAVRRPSKASSATFAVGTAAIAVACLLIAAFVLPREETDRVAIRSNPASQSDHDAVELMTLWHAEMASTESETSEIEDEFPEFSEEVVIPEWLLAGVSLEQKGTADSLPQDRKRN